MRYTDDDIVAALKAAILSAGGTREFARRCGLSPTFVSLVARGMSRPGPTIAKHLGYEDDGKRWVKHADK